MVAPFAMSVGKNLLVRHFCFSRKAEVTHEQILAHAHRNGATISFRRSWEVTSKQQRTFSL